VALSASELSREARRFGVADEQVRRDHLISHLLAALSKRCADDVIFFGGTALSRTHLVHARMSEDIDLIARGPRQLIVDRVVTAIDGELLRTHGRLTWDPPFAVRDVVPAVVRTQDGLTVQIQILHADGYEPWPVESREIEQRYEDVRAATLIVPTAPSFAAWKTVTWVHRHAPRDLYDIWAMAQRRMIDADAAALFARYGPTGSPPSAFMFAEAPNPRAWKAALAAQTRLGVSADEALAAVRGAWAEAVRETWGAPPLRRGRVAASHESPDHRGPEQSRGRGR
jgi:hypothetical protein